MSYLELQVRTSAPATHRIREILNCAKLDCRTAVGLVEFELSGRQFSPLHRRTASEVRAARRLAVAYLMAGPQADAWEMIKTANAA